MSRVLLVSTDVVGRAMAGPGIRAWELARALAAQHEVTLAAPRASDLEPDGFALATYRVGEADPLVGELLARSDVAVVQGSVVEGYPELLAGRTPLAIDLYDPMLLEGLDLVQSQDAEAARAQFARYERLTAAQLRRGDFFFCATERQRDYWLGALTLAGRITPELLAVAERDLRDVIDLVPSGIAAEPPAPGPPALRGVHPAVGEGDVVLLWAGGLWDWFEPDLLVRAAAELSVERPRLRLVFFAGARPAPDGTPIRTRAHARARAVAEELGVLDRSVVFIEEWVPYAARGAFLREADVGVSAHRPGVETRFAFRTRLLDYLWARLPYVGTSGDSLGEEIAAAGGGLLVPPGDLAGWVAALRRVADDADLRAGFRAALDPLARRYEWAEVARPLARFCARPRRTSSGGPEDPRVAELEQTLRERDVYIRHVEQHYRAAADHVRALEAELGRRQGLPDVRGALGAAVRRLARRGAPPDDE